LTVLFCFRSSTRACTESILYLILNLFSCYALFLNISRFSKEYYRNVHINEIQVSYHIRSVQHNILMIKNKIITFNVEFLIIHRERERVNAIKQNLNHLFDIYDFNGNQFLYETRINY